MTSGSDRAVVHYLWTYHRREGVWPSVAEVGQYLGLAKSSAWRRLQHMVLRGSLVAYGGRGRPRGVGLPMGHRCTTCGYPRPERPDDADV